MSEQARVVLRVAVRVGVPVGIAFGVLYFIAKLVDLPFSDLSRDPAATFDFPWYGGAVSHLGVLIAVVGAIVGFLAARLLVRLGRRRLSSLALWIGLWLLVFGIDDLLMLHEFVLPQLEVPEVVAVAVYPLSLAWIVWALRREVLNHTDYGLLGAGVALLAMQGLIDDDLFSLPVSQAALEDPLKISALILFLVYMIHIFRYALECLPDVSTENESLQTLTS